jgi:predicted nicotinamide N-methyase
MEIGCGWGIAGIYCAKRWGTRVTAVDMDAEVFPYLRLHSEINRVRVETLRTTFGGIRLEHLEGTALVIGADICFWDKMILSLKRLIGRAVRAGVRRILISDPGRPPFEELCSYYVKRGMAEVLDWTSRQPKRSQGRIMKIEIR